MNKYNENSLIVQKDSIDSVIKKAYEMSQMEYTKDFIFRILAENDIEAKIIALINLKNVDTKKEAELLLHHLTGQDGRIREAVSFVLNEIDNISSFYLDEQSAKILTDGLFDINPNVVRNVIAFMRENSSLKKAMGPIILKKTRQTIENLDKYIKEESPFVQNTAKSSKNHAKNKLTFNLYWLLSAISILDNVSEIDDILTKTAKFLDYTIREKTALILKKMENPPREILEKLTNDVNIYVKNQLL